MPPISAPMKPREPMKVVRQEQDGDADEERQGDRAEDRDAEPGEWVANGDHGSPGPPHDVRRTISTCRHRWSELIIRALRDARAEGHSCVDKGARDGDMLRAVASFEASRDVHLRIRKGPAPPGGGER